MSETTEYGENGGPKNHSSAGQSPTKATPEWVDRLTRWCRWRGMGFIDRTAVSRTPYGARLLSSTVASKRRLDNAGGRSRRSAVRRIIDSTWDWQSLPHVLRAAGLTCAAILAIVLLYPTAPLLTGASPGGDTGFVALGVLTAVVGTVVAMLVTALAFVLTPRQDEGRLKFFPFFVAKHHVFLLLGVASGIVAADGLMLALAPVVPAGTVRVALYIHVATLPFCLYVVLRFATLVTASSDWESVRPVVRSALRAIAVHEDHKELMATRYEEQLEGCGVQFEPTAWYRGLLQRRGPRLEFPLGGAGEIRDIDLMALRQIGAAVRDLAMPVGLIAEVTVGPGGRLGPHAMLVLRQQDPPLSRTTVASTPASDDSGEANAFEVPERLKRSIEGAVRRLALSRGDTATPWPTVQTLFQRLEVALLDHARARNGPRIEQAFDELSDIYDDWYDVATAGAFPESGDAWSDRFNRAIGIDLYKPLRTVVATGDAEAYAAFVHGVSKCLYRALQAKRLHAYARLGDVLASAYSLGAESEPLAKLAGEVFDAVLHHQLTPFRCRERAFGAKDEVEHAASEEEEAPFLDVALRLNLAVIRAAMERGREKDADNFVHRLVDHDITPPERFRFEPRAPTTKSAGTLHHYALILVVGWAVRLLREHDERSHPACQAAIGRAVAALPGQHELVGIWELYRDGLGGETDEDRRLGAFAWDLHGPDNSRVGVARTFVGAGSWIPAGFYLAMLKAPRPSEWELRDYFPKAPSYYQWKPDEVVDLLGDLASLPKAGLDGSARDGAVRSIMWLLGRRRRAADAARLRAVAEADLDEAVCAAAREDAARSFDEHHSWRTLISDMGGAVGAAGTASPIPTRGAVSIQREPLTPNNNWLGGPGGPLGERSAKQADVRLVAAASSVLAPGKVNDATGDLRHLIGNAVRVLKERNFTPNLMILPSQDRFAGALYRQPLFRVEGYRGRGDAYCGEWEGLHVTRAPFVDATSIIVADARRFFGRVSESAPTPRVSFVDTAPEVLANAIERSQSEEGDDLPPLDDLRVVVRLECPPAIGIQDRAAAIAIDVRSTDLLYAMSPNDDVYHRPSCPEIADAIGLTRAMEMRGVDEKQPRSPCPTCNPDRWDHDALVGRG